MRVAYCINEHESLTRLANELANISLCISVEKSVSKLVSMRLANCKSLTKSAN